MLENEDKKEEVVEDEAEKQETQTTDSKEESGSDEVEASDKSSEDDELASYSESVKKRINKLTYKTREAERREQEALEYAKAVKTELDAIKKREQSLNKSFESEAETRLNTQEALFRDKLKSAVEQGDTDRQVELQASLVQLASERERLRNYRTYRQQEEERVVEQPKAAPQPRPQPDKKAQDWAERNSWFGQDRVMTASAYAIHDDLLSEGINPSGDMYYKELDKRMREEFPHKFAKKPPSTPVASGRPSQVKKSSGDIELTDTQKIIAKRLGVSYDDYKRQLKLVQERA
jgi:DNA polymerase III gamma/tau subunit